MESAAPPVEGRVPDGSAPGEKGLKSNALGYFSNVVIGVASTAPGYPRRRPRLRRRGRASACTRRR